MKKTIATIAVAALSFAMLAGCGSRTVDPPVKSPDTKSSTSTPTKDRVAVAKDVSDFYETLAAESLTFEKNKEPLSFETFGKAFPKTLAAIDLSSFESKTHAYATISTTGSYLTFMAAKSPKVSVSDLVTIKDVSGIQVTGDKAVFKQDIVPVNKNMGVEDVTFNKVNGKWLLDGKKYTAAYFKAMGIEVNDLNFVDGDKEPSDDGHVGHDH